MEIFAPLVGVQPYVVGYGDNRASEKPFAVDLQMPSHADLSKVEAATQALNSGSLSTVALAYIRQFVKGVRNLTLVLGDGTRVVPLNGEQLAEALGQTIASVAAAIALDILTALSDIAHLQAGQEKNSEPSSPSTGESGEGQKSGVAEGVAAPAP